MSARTLPSNPNLEQLKKQAKALLKAHRSNDAEAISRLRASVPQLANASDAQIREAKFALLDAQAVIAREYGFEHWQALERHIAGQSINREFTPELRQLLKAVDEVDATTVEMMLKEHPDLAAATVYDEDVHGETLLHRAMPGSGVETTPGHLKIANLLLDCGADPNAIGWGNNNPASPPIMIAAWGGNTPMIELLLKRGANPNIQDQSGYDGLPIDTAASHGYPETVEILIDHGSEFQLKHLIEAGLDERAIAMLDADARLLEQQDGDARTALHIAVNSNNEHLIRELLQRGADIDAADARGYTTLHQAIERSNGDKNTIVRLLLDRGAELDIWAAAGLADADHANALLSADPHLADAPQRDGSTPICWAARQGDPGTIQLLIDHGVELNRPSWPRSIPLFSALRRGHEEAARLMLKAGANPNSSGNFSDGDHDTALFTAARWGSPSTVALLLDYGADINAGKMGQQFIGHGGLGWAAWGRKTEVVQLLIDRGVDLHHPNHHLIPHAAAYKGNNAIVELLAQHGADINRKDPTGQTPLAIALFRGHDDTAELLRSLGAIDTDADSNADPTTRIAAYFQAVRANDVEQVREILTTTPDLVHERIADDCSAEQWEHAKPGDRQSNTALHWTATPWGQQDQSHAALAKTLIEHGADVDALGYNDNKGVAPAVVLAAWEGSLDVLRVLLENGADPNLPGAAESALYTAIEHTAPDAPEPNKVSLLLEHGATHDIFTAAMTGRTELVATMLDEYSELINRRSLKRNRTPLEEALNYQQHEVANMLIDRGATISVHSAAALQDTSHLAKILDAEPHLLEARDDNQQTPLIIAARCGNSEIIEILLARGADPNAANRWQVTALNEAVVNGHAQAVEQLLAAGADATATNRAEKTFFDYVDPNDQAMVDVANRYKSNR